MGGVVCCRRCGQQRVDGGHTRVSARPARSGTYSSSRTEKRRRGSAARGSTAAKCRLEHLPASLGGKEQPATTNTTPPLTRYTTCFEHVIDGLPQTLTS